MAPIVASSQSKSKLRAFQFDGGKRSGGDGSSPEDTEAGKENVSLYNGGIATTAQLVPRAQTLSQRSACNETRDCPQTPVGRLALAELIASGEDLNHQSLNLTPTERVLWNQSPRSSNPTSSIVSRKGRKRAHSSSPASSSQNEASNHFITEKTSLDLQTLQKCLKTPKADPANDLWSRYSLTNERQSPTERTSLPFAHLLNSSSPQTPASHLRTKEIGGLRRSVSCTTEWPTSVAKRRKVERSFAREEIDVAFPATEGRNTGHSTTKRSRVSLLVNRLHDELARSKSAGSKDAVGPSSSSPLPEKIGFSHIAPNTTLRSSQTDGYGEASTTSQALNDEKSQISHQSQYQEVGRGLDKAKCTESDSLSDFGSDDLDLEMLKAVDADMENHSSTTFVETTRPLGDQSDGSGLGYDQSKKAPEATTSQPLGCPDTKCNASKSNLYSTSSSKLSNAAAYRDSAQPQSPQAAGVARYDEFDEDDNDISAADLEDAVAMYDLQPEAHTVNRIRPSLRDGIPGKPRAICAIHNTGSSAARSYSGNGEAEVVDLSSDDEFGGALDFDQIIAECAEATQLPQVASQPQSSVCIRHFGQSI